MGTGAFHRKADPHLPRAQNGPPDTTGTPMTPENPADTRDEGETPVGDSTPQGTAAVRLTALQEAMWRVCRRVGDPSVYHISWRLACETPLDLAALRVSWQAVVDRHEAVRLSICSDEEGLSATIPTGVTAEVQVIELAETGSPVASTLLRSLAEECHRRPFDLASPPLARLTSVHSGGYQELVLTVHHIAVDGLGMQLLFQDLADAYDAALRDEQPRFAAAPSWREFAQEDRATHDSGGWRDDVEHWRSALEGSRATTVVPDRTVYAGTGGAGTTLSYTFSEEAVRGLTALAKESSATSFAVVLAALQILLSRGGAGEDVVIGTVAANRLGERDQRLVGYLVNLCLIRAHVSQQDALSQVVDRASETAWEMFAHQAVPFPVVFSQLSEATRSALGDIAPIMLNYLGAIGSNLRLGDIRLHHLPSLNLAARTDMAVAYWHTDTHLMAEVEYSTLRYTKTTVLRLLQDLDTVLSHGTTPHLRVSEVNVRTRSMAIRPRHHSTDDALRETAHPAPASSDTARRVVTDAWFDVIGRPFSDLDENFFEAGGHSLNAVHFMATLTELTGIPLDLATWLSQPTPRSVLRQLGAGNDVSVGAGRPRSPLPSTLLRLRNGSGPHVHLFPGAGGSAQDYRPLLSLLPSDWKITFSQEREPLATIPEMAKRFLHDLAEENLRPDVLVGWSMGGQLAFEAATAHNGPTTPGLVLIDAPPPVGAALQWEPEGRRLSDFAASVCLALGVNGPPKALRTEAGPLTRKHLDSTLLVLSAGLRAEGHDVSSAALTTRWKSYEQHVQAVARYISTHVITSYAALLTADLPDEGVAAWNERFTRVPDVVHLNANHYTALRPPAVNTVAKAIRQALPDQ
ncbi:condensation domain-containing protein [Streptomyces sp. NPDC088755]|uniref:condensation domain-containing protein n=1 Tax=Streptomyces sp. NPDC088755 TaxID=3365888 RepID=UPI003813C37A